MNDAVAGLLVEREAMDRGFPAGFVLSIAAHLLLVGGSLLAAMLGPREPLINVAEGFSVALPPGGGGTPNVEPPAPAPEEAKAPPVTAAPEPPAPKILKPPKEEKRKGLPEPDAKRSKKPEKPPPTRGGVPGGAGKSAQTPGLEFGPPGPGVPGGTDLLGDWYMAAVQSKIYVLWAQQLRTGMAQPAIVSFTITADGSVKDVTLLQSCGVGMLDFAAQRAIFNAGPFAPLPKHYGTNEFTIQGIFKPGA